MKIIFMGTPEFGAIILEKLAQSEYEPVLVITAPDKPVGRKQIITPSPVKVIAQKYNISVEQPEKIKNLKPDLIIVAAYGKILPEEILEIPKYGCLNVHPSLLPKYRGPSPIQSVILNGDKKTGVTIILMDEKIDHGPILNRRTLEIGENETGESLINKLADLGANLLMETVTKWIKKIIKPEPQDETEATYTRILRKEDGMINWKKPAEDLEKEIRAYSPWPGSYTFWEKSGKLIKIEVLKARVLKSSDGIRYPIGKVLVAPQNEVCVQCGKVFSEEGGGFLVIERLQLEGKKEIDSEDLLRGYPNFVGTILG
jgi:methionyl-tRNA formyltransferase